MKERTFKDALDFQDQIEKQDREEVKYDGMKYFEVYCLKFSQVIYADSLFSAVLQFVKDNPLERVILAEDTTMFHLAKELTQSEQKETQQDQEEVHWRCLTCNAKLLKKGSDWVFMPQPETESQEDQEELFGEMLGHYNVMGWDAVSRNFTIQRNKQ